MNILKLTAEGRKAVDNKKSQKKLKEPKTKTVLVASETINLLESLKKHQITNSNNFHVEMSSLSEQSFKICVQYQINFFKPPNADTTLSASVLSIFNLSAVDGNDFEVALHYPVDEDKFIPVYMHSLSKLEDTEKYLVDESLKSLPQNLDYEKFNKMFKYENLLSVSGFQFLANLITADRKLLIEIRWKKQIFMAFINLRVFYYEGVESASFLLPVYHFNKKIVHEEFNQDLCGFSAEENLSKKEKEKTTSKLITEEIVDSKLIPWISDDKQILIKVQLKLSRPLFKETSLEDLKTAFNQHVPFFQQISEVDKIIQENEKSFEKSIYKISWKIEKIIDESPSMDDYDFEQKIKKMIEMGELYEKNVFKEVLKDLIGNKFNFVKKTETNHEFKVKLKFPQFWDHL